MIDERERPALAALDSLAIPYKRYEHACALTMEDCTDIGADVGARHCKNLFLCNRQKTDFYLVLIRGDKKFKTAVVSKLLGVSRLSFCDAEQLMDKLGLLPGSVTALGLLCPNAKDVTVVVDSEVAQFPMVCVHPCVSTASLAITGGDLMKFIKSTGNTVRILDIPAETEED
ncbi:MAG: prolyl-tRNA synthetase associated domain-containing protein [Clostridia bacterium]|nr:prolyl-tRNA synthetase associated domain-containing protein [Clostridia bacterium]